jgi:hypothetical protein
MYNPLCHRQFQALHAGNAVLALLASWRLTSADTCSARLVEVYAVLALLASWRLMRMLALLA